MMTTKDLRIYLETLVPGEKFFTGPDIPKFPHRMVILTPAGGAGLSMEDVYDQPTWQAHVVGKQSRDGRVNDSADDAEELFGLVDAAIIGPTYPIMIGTHRCIRAQRFGAGPSPLSADSGGRAHYVGTYLFEVVSGYGV
jgi:hypothetical protein